MKTQQDKVLQLLKASGSRGVNSYDLTYLHAIKQAPTRISELKEQNHRIFSRTEKNRSVTYILQSNFVPTTKNKETDEEYVWIYEGDSAKRILLSKIKPIQTSIV